MIGGLTPEQKARFEIASMRWFRGWLLPPSFPPKSQRRRLHTEYRDYLGAEPPGALDVYVITARAPNHGTRPKLAVRAHQLATDLEAQGTLSHWVRRIRLLEADLRDSRLTLRAVGLG